MADNHGLSERELEILQLVATGASNKEIAQQLYISNNTVKVHLRNVFAKIGVSSRTEAAMYAVQQGLVQPAGNGEPGLADGSHAAVLESPASRSWRTYAAWFGLVVVVVLSGVGIWALINPGALGAVDTPPTVLPEEAARWQVRADLPTPRSRLAVAAHANHLYAIGGESVEGITAVVDRFNPDTDQWESLLEKPIPVSEVGAAVIGGKIYVPGGRLSGGGVSKSLEVYDPTQAVWGRGADLPIGISAYALVEYEGNLYLFGGWDGNQYVNSVYRYEAAQDTWSLLSPMPSARAYAGAAIVDEKVYIIGGANERGPVNVNEVYFPTREGGSESPWAVVSSMPANRSGMGVTSVVGVIYVIGGESDTSEAAPALAYLPVEDDWQEFPQPFLETGVWKNMGVVLIGTQLHLLGGDLNGEYTAQNIAYQAIYTVAIPAILK